MPSKRFDFTPIPQPAAPARDQALTASSDGSRPLATARLVPIELLVADPEQPRKTFVEEGLQELADSLRAEGMRQPITAYYDDSRERFVVISGERRLLAAARAELTMVPVLVERRPASEGDKLVLQLAENLVREDLTAPDAARALGRLKELRPDDWEDVARRHGINRRRAYQYLEFLDSPPVLREAVETGRVSEGHLQELRRVPVARLQYLLGEVVAHRLSVADTRRLIAADRRTATQPPAASERDMAPEPADGIVQVLGGEAPPAPGVEAGPPPRAGDTATATTQPVTAAREGATAGAIATAMSGASDDAALPDSTSPSALPLTSSDLSPGAVLLDQKRRRERSRNLRLRLERIAGELRNMHMEEVTAELTNLPEIILQARQARESLDSFIALLERVQLDEAEPMELPPL
jgi:ParB family chromosome partitioning protein